MSLLHHRGVTTEPRPPFRRLPKITQDLLDLWDASPCFICGARGNCAHREPLVDAAELEALHRHDGLVGFYSPEDRSV